MPFSVLEECLSCKGCGKITCSSCRGREITAAVAVAVAGNKHISLTDTIVKGKLSAPTLNIAVVVAVVVAVVILAHLVAVVVRSALQRLSRSWKIYNCW